MTRYHVIRNDVFAAMLAQDIAWFDGTKTGELTSRLSSDCTSVQTALTLNLSWLIRNVSLIIGYLIFLFIISAKLTALVFTIVPIIALTTAVYVKFVKKVQTKFQVYTMKDAFYHFINYFRIYF